MSFKSYIITMAWAMAVACFFGSTIIEPRSDAPLAFFTGILFLIGAITLTYIDYSMKKKAKEKEYTEKRNEFYLMEIEQKELASLEGLAKYFKQNEIDIQKYQKGIAAMRRLGVMVEESVYQEKEKNWAILGGLADGIAGPAAGVVTAANAMQDNVRIREENAQRRAWGASQNAMYQNFADEAENLKPTSLTVDQLAKKYNVNFTYSPITLFKYISYQEPTYTLDPLTKSITVTLNWNQNRKNLWIDGSLRAKIYTNDHKLAGCAYLVLPKGGTKEYKGELSGVCTYPKYPGEYKIEIEPIDLWELSLKYGANSVNNDHLSMEQHRAIVNELKNKYESEFNR